MNPLALFAGPWGWAFKWGAIALLVGAVWLHGWVKGNGHGTEKLSDYIAKQATETVRIARGRDVVTTKVVKEYIKVQGKTQIVEKVVTREVVKYAETNPGYCLDPAWRLLHDGAATNTVPGSPGGTDAAPRAFEALEGVTANYASCQRNADRLEAIQQWLRAQSAVK